MLLSLRFLCSILWTCGHPSLLSRFCPLFLVRFARFECPLCIFRLFFSAHIKLKFYERWQNLLLLTLSEDMIFTSFLIFPLVSFHLIKTFLGPPYYSDSIILLFFDLNLTMRYQRYS